MGLVEDLTKESLQDYFNLSDAVEAVDVSQAVDGSDVVDTVPVEEAIDLVPDFGVGGQQVPLGKVKYCLSRENSEDSLE